MRLRSDNLAQVFDPNDPNLPKLEWPAEWMLLNFCVGTFVAEWSKYERQLAQLEAHTRNLPYETTRDELLRQPTREYARCLRRIREQYSNSPNVTVLLDELITLHESSVHDRHDIIHGFWQGHDEQGHFVKRPGPSPSEQRIRHFSAYDLLALNNRVQSMSLSTLRTMNAISVARGEDPPWNLV